MATVTAGPSALVRLYYADIDRGLDEIRTFYERGRIIATGEHVLDDVVSAGAEVAVRGAFRGVSHEGAPLEVRFADFWRFHGSLVVERNTYFDAAAV